MKIFQPTITGSFVVSGSATIIGLTTSSIALVNVLMISSSGQIFTTASSAIGGGGGSGAGFPYSGDAVITGSLLVSGSGITVTGSLNATSITGSLFGTSSWANNVITAQTASYSNNFTIGGTLTFDSTLTDYNQYNSTVVGSNNLFTQSTGSYKSAFGKYTLFKGSNARSGEFVTVWNETTTSYYDNSTTDIGNTADITLSSAVVSSDIQINAVANSTGWTVRMLITYM
jgi:hypothetical protein